MLEIHDEPDSGEAFKLRKRIRINCFSLRNTIKLLPLSPLSISHYDSSVSSKNLRDLVHVSFAKPFSTFLSTSTLHPPLDPRAPSTPHGISPASHPTPHHMSHTTIISHMSKCFSHECMLSYNTSTFVFIREIYIVEV